jgi:hypothetical protein
MPSACVHLAVFVVALVSGITIPQAARAQPPAAPATPPPAKVNRPPDFVLVTKKCVQVSSKLSGRKPPLQIENPKRNRESCWRSGAEITCHSGGTALVLRTNRESGPRLFATGEGGLVMLSLDWSTSTFANGITYFTDEVGIAHIQCTGKVLSGDAAAADRDSDDEDDRGGGKRDKGKKGNRGLPLLD